MSEHVWIVFEGRDYESGVTVSVYWQRDKAVAAAELKAGAMPGMTKRKDEHTAIDWYDDIESYIEVRRHEVLS